MEHAHEVWAIGAAYEAYVGRWSRRALADLLRAWLPADRDGSIPLTARAWAVRGTAIGRHG